MYVLIVDIQKKYKYLYINSNKYKYIYKMGLKK